MLKISKKYYRIAASALGIIIAGCFYFVSFYANGDRPEKANESIVVQTNQSTDGYERMQLLVCYVCGEVSNPGVYTLEADSRIFQAIEMAGGVTDVADVSHINLAQRITDGMRIYIPSQVEQTLEIETKVNINTAPKEQLMTLTGIGESKAIAIISYRETKGGFDTIEEIMEIAGIKQAAFDKIKDNITV